MFYGGTWNTPSSLILLLMLLLLFSLVMRWLCDVSAGRHACEHSYVKSYFSFSFSLVLWFLCFSSSNSCSLRVCLVHVAVMCVRNEWVPSHVKSTFHIHTVMPFLSTVIKAVVGVVHLE